MITTVGVEIAIMTGVITDTTDAMIEMGATIDGIADEITIIIIIDTIIGVTTHATTTDSSSSL